MTPTSSRVLSAKARRSSPLGPITAFLGDDPFAVAVPGVRPRAQLLMELGTADRIRLARSLFAYLRRTGRNPSALPDIFYVRFSAARGVRLPGHKILRSLLSSSQPAAAPAFVPTPSKRALTT
jgi:hypothetical protein